MFLLRSCVIMLLIGTATSVMDDFLDCPGNRPSFWDFLRRCCDDDQLPKRCECFSVETDSIYRNANLNLPECPKTLDVRFLLYTRDEDSYEIIQAHDNSIARSSFKSNTPVKVISHGYTDQAPKEWSVAMKDAILAKENVNVILVDWREGAKLHYSGAYSYAVANIRTVGAMLAKLVTVLANEHAVAYSSVHLIGHSLGAHLSGMAGKEVHRLTGNKIGRISGLDPAGPSFEDKPEGVKLTANDATFVDVIHTNAGSLGLGTDEESGDVDYWPNGGEVQPPCSAIGKCSHAIVSDYYTNSITHCSYSVGGGCKMGYYANKSYCSGHKSITTAATSPYC